MWIDWQKNEDGKRMKIADFAKIAEEAWRKYNIRRYNICG